MASEAIISALHLVCCQETQCGSAKLSFRITNQAAHAARSRLRSHNDEASVVFNLLKSRTAEQKAGSDGVAITRAAQEAA